MGVNINSKEIILESKNLHEFPNGILNMKNIRYLSLSDNNLTYIPKEISNLISLNYLDLSRNKIKYVPSEISKLKNLTRLSLGFNNIEKVFNSISGLDKLEILDLRFNNIKEVLPCISCLHNLKVLNLSMNNIVHISFKIKKLKKLNHLDLNENNLSKLTKEIFLLKKLTFLGFKSNNIREIPDEVQNLENLITLEMRNNPILYLTKNIYNLKKLIYVGVDYSNISNKNSVEEFLNKHKLNLEEYDFIPEKKSEDLKYIILRNKGLKKFPESIFKHKDTIVKLDLRNNKITDIPSEIKTLHKLILLDLSTNRLEELIEEVFLLENLEFLHLGNNKIKEVSEKISNLTKLKAFNIYNNLLRKIPEQLYKLNELNCVNLTNNSIQYIPKNVSKLKKLAFLHLSYNNIKIIPEEIIRMKSLVYFNIVNNNDLVMPPIEIAVKGLESIRNYYNQLRDGFESVYEAKLIIVGDPGAGKTTLANKIISLDYILNKNEQSTDGIDIYKWNFKIDDKSDFNINIWDFGGQQIYHTTHQFFLSKRSLYLLVADSREENMDFDYWLDIVKLLSNNSPIAIILNEKAERRKVINETDLKSKFENLNEIIRCNLSTNRGVKDIINNVKYYINKLPHIGNVMPKKWLLIRKELELKNENYISLQEYFKICENNGFKEEKDKLQLSEYLHDIGIILHFQMDIILRKIVILKPEWATDAVYKVLDNDDVINNFGHFNLNNLDKIWNDEKYKNCYAELIQLMIKFKLCYYLRNENTYIAPQLLKFEKPNYNIKYNIIDCKRIKFSYKFMPKGIISKLIVELHRYILNNEVVWNSGLVIKKNKTIAEIIEDYKEKEINISVYGDNKKDLIVIIIHKLEEIHNSFNNQLKYELKVPCNCDECKLTLEPFFYNYSTIKNFIKKNCLLIQCQKSTFFVNTIGLIDDVINKNSIKIDILKNLKDKSIVINNIIKGDESVSNNIKVNNKDGVVTNISTGNNNKMESKDIINLDERDLDLLKNVDLDELFDELYTLKKELNKNDKLKNELKEDLGNIKKAMNEINNGNKEGIIKHLIMLGKNTIAFSTGVGSGIIANIISKKLGI